MKVTRLVLILAILGMILMPLHAFAADGAAIYKAKCASCHGPDGAGQTAVGKSMKIKDLKDATDVKNVVENGKGKMPAYKGKLAADELDAVVKFVQGFKK